MKIATIIYNRNNADTLIAALDSVLGQDYKSKEVVIVDDASTDNSWQIISEWLHNKDLEETLISGNISEVSVSALRHEYESGLIGAMVSGANLVWGGIDAVGVLRAADLYLPHKLSQSAKYAEKSDDRVGILYSDYETNIGDQLVTVYHSSFTREKLPFSETAIFTKKAANEVGFIDPNKGDDAFHDFWMRITERFVAVHIPQVLTRECRKHDEKILAQT
jgi:glycosyltransferase involved in cell wall biosynthesis